MGFNIEKNSVLGQKMTQFILESFVFLELRMIITLEVLWDAGRRVKAWAVSNRSSRSLRK